MLRKNKYHCAINSTSDSSHLQVKTKQAGFGLACNQSPFSILSWHIRHFKHRAGQRIQRRGFYVSYLNASHSRPSVSRLQLPVFTQQLLVAAGVCAMCVYTSPADHVSLPASTNSESLLLQATCKPFPLKPTSHHTTTAPRYHWT